MAFEREFGDKPCHYCHIVPGGSVVPTVEAIAGSVRTTLRKGNILDQQGTVVPGTTIEIFDGPTPVTFQPLENGLTYTLFIMENKPGSRYVFSSGSAQVSSAADRMANSLMVDPTGNCEHQAF
jgi:hypothetical protein